MDKNKKKRIKDIIDLHVAITLTTSKYPSIDRDILSGMREWIIRYLCFNTIIFEIVKKCDYHILSTIVYNIANLYKKYEDSLFKKFKNYLKYYDIKYNIGSSIGYGFIRQIFNIKSLDNDIKLLLKEVKNYYIKKDLHILSLFDDKVADNDIYKYYHCSSICDLNILKLVVEYGFDSRMYFLFLRKN